MYCNMEEEEPQCALQCGFFHKKQNKNSFQANGLSPDPRKHPLLTRRDEAHRQKITKMQLQKNRSNLSVHQNHESNSGKINLSDLKARKSASNQRVQQNAVKMTAQVEEILRDYKLNSGVKSSIGFYQKIGRKEHKKNKQKYQSSLDPQFHKSSKQSVKFISSSQSDLKNKPKYCSSKKVIQEPVKFAKSQETGQESHRTDAYSQPIYPSRTIPIFQGQLQTMSLANTTNYNSINVANQASHSKGDAHRFCDAKNPGKIVCLKQITNENEKSSKKINFNAYKLYPQTAESTTHMKGEHCHTNFQQNKSQKNLQKKLNEMKPSAIWLQVDNLVVDSKSLGSSPIAQQSMDKMSYSYAIPAQENHVQPNSLIISKQLYPRGLSEDARTVHSIFSSKQNSPIPVLDESIVIMDFFAEGFIEENSAISGGKLKTYDVNK